MKFLFLEPFFGGSHQDFAEGLIEHSAHDIDLISLPARFWKWRMRGAALHFIRRITNLNQYDGLIVTDLMSLADFKALAGADCPPALVYFHENQLTYPLAPGESRDFQFGFTDITTALAAEQILFNSKTHFNAFFASLPGFLNMMPEYHPKWVIRAIRDKADVLHPGCRFSAAVDTNFQKPSPPLIVWNHRWEFDKNPGEFFSVLDATVDRGIDFRLALLGENFQVVPKDFIAARERLGERIIRYGYVESKAEYREYLARGSVVISTANQENFGISIVEAVRHGCLPLLPNRLAYPEILPVPFHNDFLYSNTAEMAEKLACMLSENGRFETARKKLACDMSSYAWENLIGRYDEVLAKLPGARQSARVCSQD